MKKKKLTLQRMKERFCPIIPIPVNIIPKPHDFLLAGKIRPVNSTRIEK